MQIDSYTILLVMLYLGVDEARAADWLERRLDGRQRRKR
jgi:hypothetical protein